MTDNRNYAIWISYHKPGLAEMYGCKSDANHILYPTWIHRVEGQDVNYLNPAWSEMVTMWFVWKNNIRTDYVGFNHYRRQFDVKRTPQSGTCQIYKMIDLGGESVYQQYARCHDRADMDMALDFLDRRYGKGNPYRRNIEESHRLVNGCCFLMRWQDFDALCDYLFGVIDNIASLNGCVRDIAKWRAKAARKFGEAKADYQMRCPAFLGERLVSAWIMTHLQPYEQRDIAIVHYNTPELTQATVKSIFKTMPDVDITIFDNSDRKPFACEMEGVSVMDNTRGQILDFDAFLDRYPNKVRSVNNWGSPKHIYTIEHLWDVFPNDFLLMDSDVLVKRDLSPFFVRYPVTRPWAGEVHWHPTNNTTTRLLPYCLWMNVRHCRANGIHFFSADRCDKLVAGPLWHDTGASFWEDCTAANMWGREIAINDYIEHLAMGSFNRSEKAANDWLEKHRTLWDI